MIIPTVESDLASLPIPVEVRLNPTRIVQNTVVSTLLMAAFIPSFPPDQFDDVPDE